MPTKYKSEDYLQECMESIEKDLSVEAFQKACCSICLNNECKRSGWGDSNWLQRMKRQENNLYNPTFYDPGQYEELANQDFITIDDDQAKVYGGWVNVKEDGTIVHHGEEETKEREADKIDESVQSLQQDDAGGREEKNGEEETKESEPPKNEVPEEKPVEEEPKKQPLDTKPVQPKHFTKKNTNAPEDGIMLGGDSPKDARREESELIKQSRKWEVSEPDKRGGDGSGGGNLTVRIDNGDVIDND